jgi:hypothetical protein
MPHQRPTHESMYPQMAHPRPHPYSWSRLQAQITTYIKPHFLASKRVSFTCTDADAKQIWQIRSEARAEGFVVEPQPQDGVLT